MSKICQSGKGQAENTQETTAAILNNAYGIFPLSVKGKMANYYALQKTIKRRLIKIVHSSAQSEIITKLVLPANYSEYNNGSIVNESFFAL